MSEVIPFPTRDCCECSQPATRHIRLYDADYAGAPVIKKYFCEEHLPREAVDGHEDD